MNKNIIKIILNLLSIILMMLFLIKTKEAWIIYFIVLLFLTTIYMHKYKNRVTKHKFMYDVVLMLLMFFSSVLLIYLIINIFKNIEYIITESQILFVIFNIYFIFKMMIDNIINLNKENSKINDYLIIVTFVIINLVFIRYYLDINIVVPNEKEYFIYQNNMYFFVMLFMIEIHKYITNKLK